LQIHRTSARIIPAPDFDYDYYSSHDDEEDYYGTDDNPMVVRI
jgi:hypothetical protein